MSDGEEIIRIAAKGDGITASGRHVAFTAPGDRVQVDGTVEAGPHHAVPPCRHFGNCGGCQLQQLDEPSLADFVASRVANAATGQGLEPDLIGPPHLSPPRTRRRASLHAQRVGGRIALGFREAGSHRIVDMHECHVLAPELFAQVAPLRRMLAAQPGKLAVEVDLALSEQGVDLVLKGLKVEGLAPTEALLDFAARQSLARVTLDQGYGPEGVWEPEPITIRLGGVPVPLPPGAFLQATRDGEEALVAAAREWLAGSVTVADLFSGLGTFAFALAGPGTKVLAAEAARETHLACKLAAGRAQVPVHALHRDLFRNPLQPDELNRFAAVLLDPPRAGAREQVGRIAESTVARVVYISCNPSSWARDAGLLIAGGYRLAELRPVGQFRWSTHVELASLFVRD
ncbi:23S rRNA (uracil1939-C5)-methyltransferase [Novosphingobium chloroacetimidivorans]|uniref:23S rRNA (Uracil1939-C5)-methyltransferase n=1 Tax=Novosphingobium chloroacetimidivorans TaxID=1428314 RepID=A0A7W7NVF4_9SPHN|nr:class I SAM-dependent RNA methyltransferase [Novosphingobium chloroacetimidivorans]MBB4857062.1 23S rRNA (uracil1939-C5)-methyltransferase [Novosphingobium chloroacetimidivorans]